MATGSVLPLDDSGKMAWPKVGDAAVFTLVPPSWSAEAVARLPERRAAFHRSGMVCGSVASA